MIDPERWHQIEQICEAALEREASSLEFRWVSVGIKAADLHETQVCATHDSAG